MGYEQLRATGAISSRTASQQRYSLRHLAIFDSDPAAIDRSLRMPVWETLFGCHRNQLVHPVIQRCVVSDKRQQSHADRSYGVAKTTISRL